VLHSAAVEANVTWTAHPARRRPRDVALVVCVLCLTAAAVLALFHSLLLTVLAAVILLASVAQFLLPTRYVLSAGALEERRLLGRRRRRRWEELRRVEIGARSALVSPFARPSFLDRTRGFVLLFDGADRDQVVRILEEKVRGG
jgi:hypothetical protein